MKIQRRPFLKWLTASASLTLWGKALATPGDDIRHILPTVTDTAFSISVSVGQPRNALQLSIDGNEVPGTRMDSKGRFWSFQAGGLKSSTRYELQLSDEDGALGQSWPLRTFPDRNAEPETFKLMTYTCAGGGDGVGLPSKQFFKPHIFRQNLFEAGLNEKPDAVIAIGDHIYYDLRGEEHPAIGRTSKWLKYLSGWYFSLRYGSFDRSAPMIGTDNEDVLIRIGDEQIADLYGTRFKSTPIYFLPDDHDYFENDDAEPDIVTFPPDKFSRAAQQAIADLYYPTLPESPGPEWNRAFGTLRYGRLFEASLFDCAGHLTVGDEAKLIPQAAEDWLTSRIKNSPATHYAMVPSHPLGWTAGKWREWYPDVVAPEGFTGVVTNELMSGPQGQMTTAAQKYFWQKGWWEQHQRLLETLAKVRQGSRMIFSGDIHAQGAVEIRKSGELVLEKPITSILVGPVSTSDATWPSAARGIAAAEPGWLATKEVIATREVNGFTIFEFEASTARARLFDCGGYDRSKGEDGRVQNVDDIVI
ncbi:MAG: phosphodiesterase [Halieaceae bacterium]|jgi:hypothetical protein|nr:phosphodiesterase [Halieaceae bacterium]